MHLVAHSQNEKPRPISRRITRTGKTAKVLIENPSRWSVSIWMRSSQLTSLFLRPRLMASTCLMPMLLYVGLLNGKKFILERGISSSNFGQIDQPSIFTSSSLSSQKKRLTKISTLTFLCSSSYLECLKSGRLDGRYEVFYLIKGHDRKVFKKTEKTIL